jgi:hypothetical protein
MPGPFPGMDPYLENHWGDVHTRIIVLSSTQLRPQLPADLRARIEEQVTVTTDDEGRAEYQPDVRVIERPDVLPGEDEGGVAVEVETTEKLIVALQRDPEIDRSVHIIDRSSGDRIVTTIEFISPWNKYRRRDRDKFLSKQQKMLDGGVNLVEVDLILSGGWVMSVPQDLLPERAIYPYRICVIRAHDLLHAECYVTSLRKPLPKIDVPLRPSDQDVKLDLQKLIDQAWEDGDYRDLDYSRAPMPAVTRDDADWIRKLIREKARR